MSPSPPPGPETLLQKSGHNLTMDVLARGGEEGTPRGPDGRDLLCPCPVLTTLHLLVTMSVESRPEYTGRHSILYIAHGHVCGRASRPSIGRRTAGAHPDAPGQLASCLAEYTKSYCTYHPPWRVCCLGVLRIRRCVWACGRVGVDGGGDPKVCVYRCRVPCGICKSSLTCMHCARGASRRV